MKAIDEFNHPTGISRYIGNPHRPLESALCTRLGANYQRQLKMAQAEQWHLRAVRYYEEHEAPNTLTHTYMCVPLYYLAALYVEQGWLVEAEEAYAQTVEHYDRQATFLNGSYTSAVTVVDCLYRYARVLDKLEKHDRANAMRAKAAEIKIRHGEDWPY